MGGTTCPKCRQYAALRKDGTLGEHRTEFYVLGQRPGGRRRERCGYAGVTPEEAKAGITVLKKRTAAYLRKRAGVE